ncbi:MAG: hypothetical protein ACM31C_11245 [Acidobacteriota bacterium]
MVAATAPVDEFRCSQCGAPMAFAPGTSQLACDHCGNAVAITLAEGVIVSYDLFGPQAKAALAAAAVVHEGREIECKQCGARAMVTGQATRCAFCDAPMVVEVDAKAPGIPPGGVQPFAIDGKAAADRFATWLRKRWFAPGDLVARSRRDKLDGIYLPYWIFDSTSTTDYDGQRGTTRWETETSRDASGNEQTRQVSHTDWFPVSGTVHVTKNDVLAIASPTLPAKLVAKLEPWELDKLRMFDHRFLAGFVAERYRVEPADGFQTAYPVIEGAIKGAIRRDIGGDSQQIDNMNVNWDSVRFRHVLMPVWLSAFHYNDKVFHVAVNAATGEVVGERPYSASKIALFVLAIAAIIAVIVVLATR